MTVPVAKDTKVPDTLKLPAVYNKPDGTLVMDGKEVTDPKALKELVVSGKFTGEEVDGKLIVQLKKTRPKTTTVRFLKAGGMNSVPHAVGEVRTVPTEEADTYLASGAAELYAEKPRVVQKPVATIKRAVREE